MKMRWVINTILEGRSCSKIFYVLVRLNTVRKKVLGDYVFTFFFFPHKTEEQVTITNDIID